jgi:acetyl-CoA carboxylase biotin carboxyl carrier protein
MSAEAPTGPAEVVATLTRELAALARLPGALRRVAMRADGVSVEVEWTTDPALPGPVPVAPASGTGGAATEVAADHVVVRAPLVGTLYTAPQPGSPPFVTPGDTVEKGQTLAIVEAMKLMNHLDAECAGTVVEVLVGDGQAVEFDQPVLVLAPTGDGAP